MDSKPKDKDSHKGKSEDVKSNISTNKEDVGETVELVPPDGGWGWAVMFGTALSNIIIYPVVQTFALLYKDKFANIGMSATDSSIIINVNSAFGMGLGLVQGAILNRYGYRKVAIAGSILTFIGLVLTSFGNSFIYFLFTYGFLTSLGVCLLYPAFSLGLNSYFRKKRGKAMGYAMTLTGIGPIIMPLVISKMMSAYGVQGTGLILGALSLHSLVGALLLQPIKWHMKKKEGDPVEDVEEGQEDKDGDHFKENSMRNGISIDHDINAQSLYGMDTPIIERRKYPRDGLRKLSVSSQNQRASHFEVETPTPESSINWWSAQSMNTINLGSSVKIFDEAGYTALRQTGDKSENTQRKRNSKRRRKGVFRRVLGRVAKVLDLSLLKDPYYINLMVGMSIAMSAELNFSLLTPFILGDMGFSNDQTASVMSAIGISDIIFRFISPFFADYMEYSARTMYLISMAMLIASRTTIIFFNTFQSLLVVAVAIGIAKGVRTVYMSLVIPSYVPIERLASASGLQMVGNGIILMVFGPLIGLLRDVTGSYNWCIVVINVMTALTATMWLLETAFTSWRRRTK
uniref:Major facilitator superfamily (MFS) profile domain-containing protein n=1 Tax=Timema genevievae TaxID=629358 RepID=A0A7R9K370_TIMGE|nr:unnamed protein product [Timema genevievae]